MIMFKLKTNNTEMKVDDEINQPNWFKKYHRNEWDDDLKININELKNHLKYLNQIKRMNYFEFNWWYTNDENIDVISFIKMNSSEHQEIINDLIVQKNKKYFKFWRRNTKIWKENNYNQRKRWCFHLLHKRNYWNIFVDALNLLIRIK